VEYAPYTVRHVTATLGLLGFTALGFFLLLKHLDPEPVVSLDTDWFYRRGLPVVLAATERALGRLDRIVGQTSDVVMRRFVIGIGAYLRKFDARVIDGTMVGVGRLTQTLSQGMRVAVSGHAQHYGLLMAAGVVAAIALAIFGL
jgi:multicomponent Na+:H+ antiporter subunit D